MKKLLLIPLMLLALSSGALLPSPASAVTQEELIRDSQCKGGDNSQCVGPAADPAYEGDCSDEKCDIFDEFLNPFINFLTIVVGVAVVIGLMVGGIMYASSAGDPQKVATAKIKMRNSIVALVLYFFLYALLTFLIPGRSLFTT